MGGHGHPDLIDYDPVHRKVYAPNRNDGLMTVIDAVSNTAIKEIGGTIGRISEITSTVASAVDEQGAATQEIARNVSEAA